MRVCVVSSNTKSLLTFRKDMMLEFIKQGHEVFAIGDEAETKWKEEFGSLGIRYLGSRIDRNGLNPLIDLLSITRLFLIFIKVKPDIAFIYQLKPILYGSIIARLSGVKKIFLLVAGLGSVIRTESESHNLMKRMVMLLFRLACHIASGIFFHNADDMQVLIKRGYVQREKCTIVNGSGVDLGKFTPTPLPEKPAFLFIGRLIRDKGLIEYLQACAHILENNNGVRCMLVGPFDSNPSAVKIEEITKYIGKNKVEYFGEQDDVRPFIDRCTTLVLPSYHEGTPKTVLEAMAMGRSIITTDAPGCRETVVQQENGLIVPVKDVGALIQAMQLLINTHELRTSMGVRSREIAVQKYDVNGINRIIVEQLGL